MSNLTIRLGEGGGGGEGVVIGRNVLKKFALKRFSGF